MAEHIPVEQHDPNTEPMHDRHGYQLKINDDIAFVGGRGKIVEYLGDAGKFGARVRVLTSTGQRVDIALLLAEAEYRKPNNTETPHSKYGV